MFLCCLAQILVLVLIRSVGSVSTASEILRDQTAVRLAYRREQRTDWVMNNWGNRNGRVGELVDLLESLQLFRPRDIILSCELTPDL